MLLRLATFNDAEAISRLIAGVYDDIFLHRDRSGAQAFLASVTPPSIASAIAARNFHYLVMEEDGVIVAAGALRDGRHIYHLWVAASHRGRGLARMLWEALRHAAIDAGNPGEFTVNASLAAMPVYAAFGFVAEGEREESGGLVYQPMAIRIA